MALSKKPIKSASSGATSVDIDALINKGGTVPKKQSNASQEQTSQGKKLLKGGKVPVQLRIAPSILDEIDALIAKRKISIARHDWFMEAIGEKMERESNEG
jgi:hypothetical protein